MNDDVEVELESQPEVGGIYMRLRSLAFAVLLVATGVLVPGQAQAATPDVWGFVHVDNPASTTWTSFDPNLEWGSWRAQFPDAHVIGVKVAKGVMRVQFPHSAHPNGVAHVTSNDRNGNYCQVATWYQYNISEIVEIHCWAPSGLNADTRFSLLWTGSSGSLPPISLGDYDYVHYGENASLIGYSTGGSVPKVSKLSTGTYSVRFIDTGLTNNLSGNIQVTAVKQTGPRRCNVYGWTTDGNDVLVTVRCYDFLGNIADSGFAASHHHMRSVVDAHPPQNFGHVWQGGSAYPFTNYNNQDSAPNVSIVVSGSIYIVTYPLDGVAEVHSQVTAHSAFADYCNVTWLSNTSPVGSPPSDGRAEVRCFDKTGALKPLKFFHAYTSRT